MNRHQGRADFFWGGGVLERIFTLSPITSLFATYAHFEKSHFTRPVMKHVHSDLRKSKMRIVSSVYQCFQQRGEAQLNSYI